MIYACQRDSYLRELTTKVLSCTPAVSDENPENVTYYEVVVEDTVLFPEGGGQPGDKGALNGMPVVGVKKRNKQAIHFLTSPVAVNGVAQLTVCWDRRFDHMQQHTAQHLITAIMETTLNFCTTSWCLGEDESYIELDTPSISEDQLQQIESMVNEVIRMCVTVSVHYFERGDPELSKVRSRLELPHDHGDLIRVVRIHGIDSNTCCGTHVKNSAELQAIKLLYSEKGKRGKTNVYFIAGDRLLKHAGVCTSRERALTQLLGCCPEDHHKFVNNLQKSLKFSNKNLQTAIHDVASLEARLFNLQNPPPPYFFLHRKNADPDFISVFLNEVKSEKTLFFLTVNDSETSGHMVMAGPLPLVETYGPLVCSILEGKGAVRNRKFQGKIKNIRNVGQAERMLKSIEEEIIAQLQ